MNEYTEIVYDEVKAATDKAVLLLIDDEKHWVPLSQIDGNPDFDESGPGVIDVAVWFATKEGLV